MDVDFRKEIMIEIAEKICKSWGLEKPPINFYGWFTLFDLDNESVYIEDDLLKEKDIKKVVFALIHEISHYVIYQAWKQKLLITDIMKHPHNTDFCIVLYTNIKTAGFSIQSYLKNAIEYPIVKKILKEIEKENLKNKSEL